MNRILGIDVLTRAAGACQDFIKEFELIWRANLPTRMLLLGDKFDATIFDFILPALNNSTWRYCAVSPSRRTDDVTLRKRADAAKAINVPLLVGEGSTDAAAHGYAEIFNESTFALYEINLYTRICAIGQPLSILQVAAYFRLFVVVGRRHYGHSALCVLRNVSEYQAIGLHSADALAIPVSSSKENVTVRLSETWRVGNMPHMVNNGADCEAVISGIPQK